MDTTVTPPPRPHHPRSTSFLELCQRVGIDPVTTDDATVTGVAINASQVVPGDVFVALAGSSHHGALFAADALAAGATAVITDSEGLALLGHPEYPIGIHPHPREILGHVSADVYSGPAPRPTVLAVTGTNGKTSVTFFLEDICRRLGHITALSNTSERRVAGERFRTKLTTPEANELHAMLALGAETGVATLCLEASAQAIERSRLNAIAVKVAGFTNLSHDHFEDYGDMDTYLQTKAALFTRMYSESAVICVDTPWGQKLADLTNVPTTTIAHQDHPEASRANWTYRINRSDGETTEFSVTGPDGELSTRIFALGRHMVQNAALAIAMVAQSGVALDELRQAIASPHGELGVVIPGRLEKVSGDSPLPVYVDAGRSEDAYRQTLTALRPLATGSLITVCGTSGNRDASKRPLMGQAAAELSDLVVITDDDPRWEDPAEIRRGLIEGATRVTTGAALVEIADPIEAIDHAVSVARPGDVVVWLGPGSQVYREISGERVPFSARREVQGALDRHGYTNGEGDGDV